MSVKYTTEKFIEDAKKIHGNKYDYSLVNYIDVHTKVIILCPIHGEFKQNYQKHCYNGRGCGECGKISCANKNRFSQDGFIEKAVERHDNFYSYNRTIYTNYKDEVTVTCPIHGDFMQRASDHLAGRGCQKCGAIKSSIARRKGENDILKKFEETHGNFYKYELPENIKVKDIINIHCPIHGLFLQTVNVHYVSGCPKCANIKCSEVRRKIPIELKRVVKNIKRRVKGFIKNEGYRKTSPTNVIIGIDWVGLKSHLESNPYNFKVDCEDLDIDHIVPLCSIKSEEDVYKLNHYTNLQLLPKVYNQFIKKESPFNREHFENWIIETNYKLC